MRRVAAFVLVFLVSCRGCADETRPRPTLTPTVSVDAEPYRLRARVPAIAWATFSADAWSTGAVGHADVEAKVLATDATPFEAASIAKMVIAVAVMQVVEENLVTLDGDISKWVGIPLPPVPSSGGRKTPITLRHLLTHTASIVDGPETAARGDTALADFLQGYFADAGHAVYMDASPGTSASYSNVGPSLAALIVERVTRVDFAEHARTRIFEPLGMTTAFFARGTTPTTAVPYASRGPELVRLPPPSHALYPVVDLFASARDLVRFGRAIARGGELDGVRVLRAESAAEMLRVPFEAAPDDALGFQVRHLGGTRVVGHEGEDVGASTAMYLDPAAHVGAVILANGDAFRSDDRARAQALGDLMEKLLRAAR